MACRIATLRMIGHDPQTAPSPFALDASLPRSAVAATGTYGEAR
jgi:hypothetical protein